MKKVVNYFICLFNQKKINKIYPSKSITEYDLLCNRIRIKKESIRIIEECLSENLSNKENSLNQNK
jgi:hypothetical protein